MSSDWLEKQGIASIIAIWELKYTKLKSIKRPAIFLFLINLSKTGFWMSNIEMNIIILDGRATLPGEAKLPGR